MTKHEKVLCAPRATLPEVWLGQETALRMSEPVCFAALEAAGCAFLERSRVERDPRWKQIIPYVLAWVPKQNAVGCYRRKGSETRLHGLESVGIGGHVTEGDARGFSGNLYAAVRHGMMREIAEEFDRLPALAVPVFCGVINEERSNVGEVHLGLVFRLHVLAPERIVPGKELGGFRWLPLKEALARPLELWSRLALSLLG